MALKTILFDPAKNEVVENAAKLAADFNRKNPDHLAFTEQDRNDLNDMFLEAGLLEEYTPP